MHHQRTRAFGSRNPLTRAANASSLIVSMCRSSVEVIPPARPTNASLRVLLSASCWTRPANRSFATPDDRARRPAPTANFSAHTASSDDDGGVTRPAVAVVTGGARGLGAAL